MRQWGYIPLGIFIVLALFFWRGLSLDPQQLPSVKVGKPLPSFQLPELLAPESIFSSQQLNHRYNLLNVWASWCEACTEEQPFLMQLASEGVAIYGLNYKDAPENARQWLMEWGNPYQNIGADVQGKVAIDLGTYGAPETFLVDHNGIILYRHAGPLTSDIWKKQFAPLIQSLRQ